jgi:ankyrin repeat protein
MKYGGSGDMEELISTRTTRTTRTKLFCDTITENANKQNDETKENFLMCAAKNGLFDICQKLIDNGAEVNIQDNEGKTALMHAVENSTITNKDDIIRCFKLLIEKGASFDNSLVNKRGESTFQMACESLMIECVELLFSKGYKMSENDKNVLFAVIGNFYIKYQKINESKKLEKLEKLKIFLILLLDHGASTTGTTEQNPIDIARRYEMTEIVELLEHKPILDSLERAEFEKKENKSLSIEESKEKLREIEKELEINDKSIDEIKGEYLRKIKSFIKAYILLKGGKKFKKNSKNKRSQKTKTRNFRKTRHRSRV